MQIDVTRYLGAVERRVEFREQDGRRMAAVIASRVFDTDEADLWDAVTNPERLPRWFAPVRGDFHLGGRYQVEGNASGTITACEPPRHLSLTWEFAGHVSWVEVRLAAASEGRTRLTLEHLAEVSEFWDRYGPGASGVGWELGLLGLALHLEGKGAFERSAGEAWAISDEGKQFVRGSSAAWGDAAVAAGTPKADARAAEARTTAFYLGEASGEAG